MDEFKDILLDGEEVLWSGGQHPDYVRAQRTVKLFFSALVAMTLLALSIVCFTSLWRNHAAGSIISASSIGWSLGGLFFGYLTVSVVFSAIGNLLVTRMTLIVTDRRIILTDSHLGMRRVFSGRPFQEIMVISDKKFLTLKASGYATDDKEGHNLKIRGLVDAHAVERIIQERFMAIDEEKRDEQAHPPG